VRNGTVIYGGSTVLIIQNNGYSTNMQPSSPPAKPTSCSKTNLRTMSSGYNNTVNKADFNCSWMGNKYLFVQLPESASANTNSGEETTATSH